MCVEEEAEEREVAAGPAHAAVSVSLRAPLTLPPTYSTQSSLSLSLFLGLVTTQNPFGCFCNPGFMNFMDFYMIFMISLTEWNS